MSTFSALLEIEATTTQGRTPKDKKKEIKPDVKPRVLGSGDAKYALKKDLKKGVGKCRRILNTWMASCII